MYGTNGWPSTPITLSVASFFTACMPQDKSETRAGRKQAENGLFQASDSRFCNRRLQKTPAPDVHGLDR